MIKSQIFAGRMLICICFAIGVNQVLAAESPVTTQPQPQPQPQPVTQDAAISPDEAAIRESGKSFAQAFKAGDAKAIAALWTADGEYVNESGQRFAGREAIQKEYEKFFAQYPGVQIQVKTDSVKMLSPDSAITEGTGTLGAADAPSPVSSHYMVVHVKRNNQWLMASVRDVRVVVASNAGKVEDLAGLMGKWQATNGSTTLVMNCRWIADKKFAERTYSVSENGNVTHSGKQIIGWDPVSQQVTSWLFDSSGGHDVGTWTPQKKGWIVQSSGVLADGTPTSAVNQITAVDDNTASWKSTDRFAGDQALPDSAEVLIKRVAAGR